MNNPLIDWNFKIVTDLLQIHLAPDPKLSGTRCSLRKENGQITITCAPDFDFQAPGKQAWLTKVIEEQVRSYARGILPSQLRQLATDNDLHVDIIKINSARGRWGSCIERRTSKFSLSSLLFGPQKTDTKFTINLSFFVLLLPLHLQKLVMLHELTHTLEMNHSPRFHQKLNTMLGGNEKALEKELKHYSTNIFCFSNYATSTTSK